MKKKWLHAGITTYVIMMLGFTIMFYLFGYTPIWTNYASQPVIYGSGINGTNITNASGIAGNPNLFDNIGTVLLGPGGLIILIGGIAIGIGFLVGAAGTVLSLIFPLILLIMCNIFIFPVMPGTETHINDIYPLTAFLIGFFNLWFILAIIEFIRG